MHVARCHPLVHLSSLDLHTPVFVQTDADISYKQVTHAFKGFTELSCRQIEILFTVLECLLHVPWCSTTKITFGCVSNKCVNNATHEEVKRQ
jgi:hypothetical protein